MHPVVREVYKDIRKKKKKLTKTRKTMIEMLVSSHILMTASQIQEKLDNLGISVNKTSVYRELNFLLKNEIIQEVVTRPRVTHYESALHPHHHHITCKSCGNIKDIETSELDSSMKMLEKKINAEGFEVSKHILEFFGTCANCK